MDELWNAIEEIIYKYEGKWAKLGFPPEEGYTG